MRSRTAKSEETLIHKSHAFQGQTASAHELRCNFEASNQAVAVDWCRRWTQLLQSPCLRSRLEMHSLRAMRRLLPTDVGQHCPNCEAFWGADLRSYSRNTDLGEREATHAFVKCKILLGKGPTKNLTDVLQILVWKVCSPSLHFLRMDFVPSRSHSTSNAPFRGVKATVGDGSAIICGFAYRNQPALVQRSCHRVRLQRLLLETPVETNSRRAGGASVGGRFRAKRPQQQQPNRKTASEASKHAVLNHAFLPLRWHGKTLL